MITVISSYGHKQNTAGAGIDTSSADLIIAGMAVAGNASAGMTDSEGNAYTLVNYEVANNLYAYIWYCIDPTTSETHTFTGDPAGQGVAALALSSGGGGFSFDQESGSGGAGVGSVAPGSITPGQADSVAFVSMVGDGNEPTAISAGTIFHSAANQSFVNLAQAFAHHIQTSAAATNPSLSWTGTQNATVKMATFTTTGGASAYANLQQRFSP